MLSGSWPSQSMVFQVFIHVFLSCLFDYLELRDGSTSDTGLISRLCGNTQPSTQHSTGSTMLLRFRTDTSVTHKGFKAKYSIGRQIRVITHNLKMVFQSQCLVFGYGSKLWHSWLRFKSKKSNLYMYTNQHFKLLSVNCRRVVFEHKSLEILIANSDSCHHFFLRHCQWMLSKKEKLFKSYIGGLTTGFRLYSFSSPKTWETDGNIDAAKWLIVFISRL